MMILPSLAFWEEVEGEEFGRLVSVADDEFPESTRPHCRWCDINVWHPNCVLNAGEFKNACPECVSAAEDITEHAEFCPRIGTTGQCGPPWEPAPWSIKPPSDFTSGALRVAWRRTIVQHVICYMAGKVVLSSGGLETLTWKDQVEVAKEMVPPPQLHAWFEEFECQP